MLLLGGTISLVWSKGAVFLRSSSHWNRWQSTEQTSGGPNNCAAADFLEMNTMLRNMVAVLAAIGLVFALAAALPVQGQQSLFPYPRSTKPVESVTVYSDMYLDPQDNLLITLLTLGGGLARSQPRLYRIPKLYSPTPSDDSYSTWLTTMRKHCPNQKFEIDLSMIQKPYQILSLFRKDITGYVLYNTSDSSVNTALTYIAAQNSSEL